MIERRITGRVPLPFVRTNDWSILIVSNGKALQIGERGVAGAEVVERQAGAEFADALQHLRGVLGILHHQRLGELELERSARQAGARNHRAQIVDQILPQQLPRRHVDAGEQRIALTHGALPAASCRAVRSSTNMPRSTMRPISSAMAMNSEGEVRPILG